MTETFEQLTLRLHAQDPDLTPDNLEKLISDRVGERVAALFEEIKTGTDTALLRQAIKERLGCDCEIVPEMALYVNIGNSKDRPSIIPFSSRALESAIQDILTKDFSAFKPEEIMQLIHNTITNSCHHFLQAIILLYYSGKSRQV